MNTLLTLFVAVAAAVVDVAVAVVGDVVVAGGVAVVAAVVVRARQASLKGPNYPTAIARSASCRPLIAELFHSARLVSLQCKPRPFPQLTYLRLTRYVLRQYGESFALCPSTAPDNSVTIWAPGHKSE